MYAEVRIIVPDHTCRVCGFSRADGRHLSVSECAQRMERSCDYPQEHHAFRRRWLPIKIERMF